MRNDSVARLRSALPAAAVISALSLAWTMGGQLLSVRDNLVLNCHNLELRVRSVEEWRSMHTSIDEAQSRELVTLIKQLSRQP